MKILLNKAQCNICKDIIESMSVHDFRWCKCGAIAVDGGLEYFRRLGRLEDIIELSEYTDIEDNPRLRNERAQEPRQDSLHSL